jgi:Cu/Ag efflux pump CusA
LAPLIAETSFQAQFLIPMAIAIAYGLIVATLLSLVFLPALLVIFNKVRYGKEWLFTGKLLNAEEREPAVKELEIEQLKID